MAPVTNMRYGSVLSQPTPPPLHLRLIWRATAVSCAPKLANKVVSMAAKRGCKQGYKHACKHGCKQGCKQQKYVRLDHRWRGSGKTIPTHQIITFSLKILILNFLLLKKERSSFSHLSLHWCDFQGAFWSQKKLYMKTSYFVRSWWRVFRLTASISSIFKAQCLEICSCACCAVLCRN